MTKANKVIRVEIVANVNGQRETHRINIEELSRSESTAIARAGIAFGDILQIRADGTDTEIDVDLIDARIVQQWTDVEALPS